jgi:hypothetical protein
MVDRNRRSAADDVRLMPSGPAFVFHIGPHKTGTTYLQTRFEALRAALAGQGVLYPPHWQDGPGKGHAALAARLKAGDYARLAGEFAALLDQPADTVLISAEDLSSLAPDALAALRAMLAGRAARFVFYTRRWSALLPSIWQERVKQGQSYSFPEFLVSCLRNPAETPVLNVSLRLENFGQVFGAASVHLVSHSELEDRGIDLFSHFTANFLHWRDPPTQDGGAPVNASRDAATIEIVRLVNSLSRQRGAVPGDRLRVAFDRLPERDALRPVMAAIEAHTRTMRLNDRWPGLAALHESLVTQYGARMVAPKRPALLFKPGVRDVPFADPAYLAEPGVAESLRGLHARLDAFAAPPARL